MNPERLKDIGLGIGFVLVQLVLFRHLKIFQMQPDLVLIFITWFLIRNDRTSAIIMAAGLGFLQDALLDTWGLNMFSKTLLTFAVYNFIPKGLNQRMLVGQVFLTVLVVCLLHNLIFLGLNTVMVNYSAEGLFWRFLFGNSVYTAVVASFIQMFRT
ncbi:MAG TPA: rod shape-determining protein MreD [Balneolaceae bacterium]